MYSSSPSPSASTPLLYWQDAQWRAIASPLRFELVIVASSICPATAQDFADVTGRSRASIYPHIQALVDADFLRVVEHRPSARRPVAVYGEGPMLDARPYDPACLTRVKEWIRCSRAFFRLQSREHEATMKALDGCETLVEGLDMHYLFGKIMRLDKAGMEELIGLKNQIRDFASRHTHSGNGEIVRMMVGIIPDQRSPAVLAAQRRRGAARKPG